MRKKKGFLVKLKTEDDSEDDYKPDHFDALEKSFQVVMSNLTSK